ncbi:hypothetical protein QKU48_gp0530 [Fadolivirus algeromassiliense]|jgi:hypothetical protein|uniref:Uncharacterized protein n=1 Tax=Fadolivirus FV1/VV64 TaxID=3070911 RepID=A0A7D3UPK1_9VIRU|nr:hypothetical protein QKU48_gp0530 [Fadolivirus algeromassiliense]QKF93988.1 hypothetical protein Fadolivirus_1_530 [Fadolivirus FV1/VV64]
MQGSFEDIYNRLERNIKNDIYYFDINEIKNEYEIITFNDIINNSIFDDDIVKIELLNESQLLTSDKNIKDNVIVFNTLQYIDKIAKSFKYNTDRIECQFDMDFHRSLLYFNNTVIKNKPKFIDNLQKFKDTIIDINGNMMGLNKLILMLCNQASLAFSFLLMSKMYNNMKKGIYVTSKEAKYYITLNDDNSLSMELNAIYNLKDTNNNKNISEINIVTNVDAIFKDKKYELCKLGIIYWNFQDIH